MRHHITPDDLIALASDAAADRLAELRAQAEIRELAKAVMRQLSRREREVVACIRAELTLSETAAVLELTRGSVWVLWRRASRKLQRLSAGDLSAPEKNR